jgi:L-seryl-tRNA(Ser) seleniumtransferase
VLALTVPHPNRFLARLREAGRGLPVIARLEDEKVVFDPRTVLEEQEKILLPMLAHTL